MGMSVQFSQPLSSMPSQAVRFGNRRDGAKNPRPSDTNREIWERHRDDWRRLYEEEGLYVWQVRASYHYLSIRVEPLNKRFGLFGPSEESVKEKLVEILGDRYGDITVRLEKAQRGLLTKLGEGCCETKCTGCNHGDTEKRLFIQG